MTPKLLEKLKREAAALENTGGKPGRDLGPPRTLRACHDRYRQGLERLKRRALRVQDLVRSGHPNERMDALHVLRSMVELAR
jgi:hypothetical protein